MKPAVASKCMLGVLVLGGLVHLCRPALAGSDKAVRHQNQAAADALFTNGGLPVLKIEIARDGINSLGRNGRVYVPATLREGPLVLANVMVRLKGGAGSFRSLDEKPGLTLKLDESPATFHGLKKFHLNNCVQDDTYLSEWSCSEIFRRAGVPAARVAHAVVELNGRRLGLYIILESVDHDFLSRYFKSSHGNVYSLGPNADINQELERIGGHEETVGRDLKALAAAAAESDRERLPNRLAQVLDVPRFLSFMAVEVMLDDWDGYTANIKNYFVYHDLDTGRMIFMPHDMDQMLRDPDAPIIPREPHGLVARAILRSPQTRLCYRARFEEVFTNIFESTALNQRIDQQVTRLLPALRQYDPGLAGRFANNAQNLKNRINRRAKALAMQLRMPDPGRIDFVNNVLAVKDWRVANSSPNTKQERLSDASGKACLWIGASGPTTASWRARVLLDPGQYVFEGRACSSRIEPLRGDDRGQGAGLRISGSSRNASNELVGDASWQRLAFEFEVTNDHPDVELICELRARKGEVWFEEQSLRLLRRK